MNIECICLHCKKVFVRYASPSRKTPFKYCSRVCASRATSPGQRTYDAIFERWVKKYGKEEAEKMLDETKRKRSLITTEKNKGRKLSDQTREKISNSCKGIPNKLKGKTFKEFYGEERAIELSTQHSEKLKEGYALGKIKPNARSKNAPAYKGVKLRSKLELDVIRHLEKTHNLIFCVDLLYEHEETRVTWNDDEGKSHTYTPDLYNKRDNIVYEVKPDWRVKNPTREMILKEQAAMKKLSKFCYLLDKII